MSTALSTHEESTEHEAFRAELNAHKYGLYTLCAAVGLLSAAMALFARRNEEAQELMQDEIDFMLGLVEGKSV